MEAPVIRHRHARALPGALFLLFLFAALDVAAGLLARAAAL